MPRMKSLLAFLLAPVLFVASVSVSGTGTWKGIMNDTKNDACLMGIAGTFLSSSYCSRMTGLRFVDVSVPRGSEILSAYVGFFCQIPIASSLLQLYFENVSNSLPFTNMSEDRGRSWVQIVSVYNVQPSFYEVGDAIFNIVSKNDWVIGNSVTFQVYQRNPNGVPDSTCILFPNWNSTLQINYRVQGGNMELQGPFTLVPVTGNWTSGSLNVTSLNSSLSVGILNMKIVNPFYFTITNLTVTKGFISNGQYTFNCLSLQTASFEDKRNVTCELPCAPGTGYKLTVNLCLNPQSSLPISWSPTGDCFDVTANGTINFPDPILMPATLLPDDERPYAMGAGLLNATATVQVISNRDKFTATMGVQYLCTSSLSQWATFQFGNFPITDVQVLGVRPPLASRDYTTLSLPVPLCQDSACPELVPMNVTMRYMNSTTMTTKDRLVYPTKPVIAAVSGCEDISATTINCPSSGGVWMNITMSQSSGYVGVSVDVGGSQCTNVSVSSSRVACLLPPGVGTFRPVKVTSGSSTSDSVYISYAAPTITRLEGGAGCVPDASFLNSTGLDNNDVCGADTATTFSAAVKMCDRDGSDMIPLTIIGDNFGPVSVPVLLKLQGTTLNVTKDEDDPYKKLYFYLPAGPGSGARLSLTVRVDLQTASALVSYEPCPQGQGANCIACEAGRYGLATPVCEPCQKGRYQPKPGQSVCALCPKGTYQPALGQASCIACPSGQTSIGVGSDSSTVCNSCPLTHYLDANKTECLRCAPNSIPYGSSCGCVSGFFDDRAEVVVVEGEGDGTSLNCQPCPSGANCQKTGTRFATMGPLAGWWRSGLGTFAQCLEPVNCVGVEWGAFSASAADMNSSSSTVSVPSLMCVSHRSGVLCAECEQGYQPISLRGGPCVPCDEDSSLAWVWASVVIVLLMIGLLSVGFYIYRKRQIRKLFAAMSSSAPSSPRQSPTNSLSGHSPSSSSPSSPSNQQQAGLRQYGSVVPELVKKHQKQARDTTSTIVSTSKILIGFLQILSSMMTGNVSLPTTFAQVARVFSFLNFDFMPWASIRCVFHIDFYTRIYLSCLYPFLIVGLLLLCVGLPVALSNKRDYLDEETFRHIRSQFWTQTVTLALFCVFLLYPWVTLQLLQFGICLRVDDKYYLVADMSQLCLEGEWLSHLGPVIGLFLLLSVGIPATLGALLYRSRGRLRTKHVRQRLGFLYLAYSDECWWFEIVELSTRVCLISIVRCFDPSLHALLRMICCLAYIVVVLLMMPFVYHSLDSLSLLCMAELMLVACLAHLLPVVGEWQGTFVDDLLSALMLALFFIFLLYTLFQVMRATRWLSHRPWAQRLLHKTPETSSDLQLGTMLKEPNQTVETDDSSKNGSVQQ